MELEVKCIGVGLTPYGYAMILEEPNSKLVLPVYVSDLEAQRIVELQKIKLSGKKPGRPWTHDLMQSIATAGGLRPVKVVIPELRGAPGSDAKTFIAEIHFEKETEVAGGIAVGSKIIDARPSDAVPFAITADIPIFVEESVLKEAGQVMPQNPCGSCGGGAPCGGSEGSA